MSADCEDDGDDGLQCDGEVMDEDEWSDEECEGVSDGMYGRLSQP